MSAVLFLVGYIFAGTALANVLAEYDPEPLGAFASLVLFCFVGAVVSAVSYYLSSLTSSRFPSKLAGLAAGVICASIFSVAMGAIYLGLGFLTSICLAFVLSLAVAACSPFFGAKKNA